MCTDANAALPLLERGPATAGGDALAAWPPQLLASFQARLHATPGARPGARLLLLMLNAHSLLICCCL
jgi:hypothetical protein